MNEWLVVVFMAIFFVLVACVLVATTLGVWTGVHKTIGWAGRQLRRVR